MPSLRITPAAEVLRDRAAPCDPAGPGTPLSATLAAAATVGPRSGLATAPGSEPGRIPAAALLEDGELLDAAVAARGAALGTDRPGVASTLFLQGYVYRMAAPVLAAWVLHRRVPDVSAGNVTLVWRDGRPEHVALTAMRLAGLPGDHADDAEIRPVPDLVAEVQRVLLDEHLLRIHDQLRRRFRMGATIAQGAVASQIGMALTEIDACSDAGWDHVAGDSVALLRRTRDRIGGEGRTGDIVVLEDGRRVGMTWRRHTCCLVYCCPGREECGGCPRRSDGDRADVWAARLAARERA